MKNLYCGFRGLPGCRKTSASLSRQFAASSNRRLQFHKRSQLFIRVHNEPLSVAAIAAHVNIFETLATRNSVSGWVIG